MEKDSKAMDSAQTDSGPEALYSRRDFLEGLGKWSKIVIGAAVFGGSLLHAGRGDEAGAAGWANRGGGGGAAWANRGGGGGGGAAWANRHGGGGAWANRGAAWANRGGSWINRF